MQTFQKPLSESEEARYLQLLSSNDETDRITAKQVLIEHNLRLVAHIVKKYPMVDEDLEDMISIGTIGLIKAIETYDYSKGSKLATYAARCIDNELLMMLRARKKIAKEVSIYEPIGTDKEGNEISLLDIIEAETKDVTQTMIVNEYASKLVEIIDKALTSRERLIIVKRYGLLDGKEMTQREIGKQLDISRSYVSRIEKKALKKLRNALECHK